MSEAHASEMLLNGVPGDSSDAIAGIAAGEDEPHSKSRELFTHISEDFSLELNEENRRRILLKKARNGDTYDIKPHAHIHFKSEAV